MRRLRHRRILNIALSLLCIHVACGLPIGLMAKSGEGLGKVWAETGRLEMKEGPLNSAKLLSAGGISTTSPSILQYHVIGR